MLKHKRALGGALTLAVAMGVVGGVLPATATAVPAAESTAGESAHHADDARLRALLHRLTTVDGAPGALAEVRDRHRSKVLTSGVADVDSHAPVHRDSRFRIGSMTKTFTATMMLQLVGERRVDLDAPVERYLPGVVRGHGNDGRKITVRQILQHTSGLPDFLAYLKPQDVVQDPMAHHAPHDLVKLALAHPPTFKPGTDWKYSNTGYVLAGMIIEKVTGRSYDEELQRRIVRPLHLRGTSFPGDDPTIPGPHPRGYAQPGPDAPLLDITAINPTVGGTAGGIISSGTDINRFLSALLGGKLLPPAQLKAMMKTRPTGSSDGRAYGLGLESKPLPGGGLYWGHTGDFLGYETAAAATIDGRQATVMVNLGPGGSDAQSDDIQAAIETALSS
ncbi:D-alanyl-D-alanine carboxypeptidase [Streptomyces aureoverticillatus]|nr:D-alanyl-D-alanine carboxypeptidase [Streptomyces aureoverticillatus]